MHEKRIRRDGLWCTRDLRQHVGRHRERRSPPPENTLLRPQLSSNSRRSEMPQIHLALDRAKFTHRDMEWSHRNEKWPKWFNQGIFKITNRLLIF